MAIFNDWKESPSSLFAPYKNYFVQVAILETLLVHGDVLIPDLLGLLMRKMTNNSEIMWSITLPYLRDRIIYLGKLGIIEVEAGNDIIKISEEGKNLLKSGTFQNATYTTFFNYKSLNVSRWALVISILAAIFSLIALAK